MSNLTEKFDESEKLEIDSNLLLREMASAEDFVYKKNGKNAFYISAQIIFRNLNTNSFKKEFFNIDLIFNKAIGRIFDLDDNIVNTNAKSKTQKIIFKVDETDLNKISKKLNHYNEFDLKSDDIPHFVDSVIKPNYLYDKFYYTPVHLLKSNREINDIDYFILPSYEVLRYFFLKGSKLNKFLFNRFLFTKKGFSNESNELFIKKEINENGEKGNYLLTRQGFKDVEYHVICRMAYTINAFKCIEEIRKSLLISSQKAIEPEFKILKTILPHDGPFEIECSGKRFMFKGKNYFIINEIHRDKDYSPIKDIKLIFFADRRRNSKENNGSKNDDTGNVRVIKRSKQTPNTKITSEELGNEDVQANIEINDNNESNYEDSGFNLIKLDKVDSGNKYNKTVTNEIPKEVLSLLGEIDKNSKAGRATTIIVTDNNLEDEEAKKKREIFYSALISLRSNNRNVVFFKIKTPDVSLFSDYSTLVEPDKKDLLYKTIISQIKVKKDNDFFYLYIVRSDNREDEVSRYAIFNLNSFQKFDLGKLKELYSDIFLKKGLKFKVKDLKNNNYNLQSSIEFHNQSKKNAKDLFEKIEIEIENKIKKS